MGHFFSQWHNFPRPYSHVVATQVAAKELAPGPTVLPQRGFHGHGCTEIAGSGWLISGNIPSRHGWWTTGTPMTMEPSKYIGVHGRMMYRCGEDQLDWTQEMLRLKWWCPQNGGTPVAGWFIRDNSIKWMIWGFPYFRKPPNGRVANAFQTETLLASSTGGCLLSIRFFSQWFLPSDLHLENSSPLPFFWC